MFSGQAEVIKILLSTNVVAVLWILKTLRSLKNDVSKTLVSAISHMNQVNQRHWSLPLEGIESCLER